MGLQREQVRIEAGIGYACGLGQRCRMVQQHWSLIRHNCHMLRRSKGKDMEEGLEGRMDCEGDFVGCSGLEGELELGGEHAGCVGRRQFSVDL